MRILGISAYYHDSAAALVVDGTPLAAAQEERFTRRKHDPAFPTNATRYCLAEAGVFVFSTLIVPVGAMKNHLAKNALSRTEKAPLPRSKRAEEMRMAKKKSRNVRPWKYSSSARPRGSMVET